MTTLKPPSLPTTTGTTHDDFASKTKLRSAEELTIGLTKSLLSNQIRPFLARRCDR